MLVILITGQHSGSAVRKGFRFNAAELGDKTLWTQVNTHPFPRRLTAFAACHRAPTMRRK
jgi:hypothetical protein